MIMIQKLKSLFLRKKKTSVTLLPFAVEVYAVLDGGHNLDRFTAIIFAQSKKDAKEQVKRRVTIKCGAVANRHTINRFRDKLKNQINGEESKEMKGPEIAPE